MKLVKPTMMASGTVNGTRRQRSKQIFDNKKQDDKNTKVVFREFRQKERERAGSIWQAHKDIVNVILKGEEGGKEVKKEKELKMTEEEIVKNDSFFEPVD